MSENIETDSRAVSANQICLNTHRCQCVTTSPHVISENKTERVSLKGMLPYK